MSHPLHAAFLLAVVPASLFAQTTDADSLQHDLSQVVVTGTRTPRHLKDVPIQTRVITLDDIRKTDATNVQDLLQSEIPGVEFSYAKNQQVNMNMAGFAGQSVLFLVDGERLAGETMDNVDFTRLSMVDVERIEIVKGNASALYGSSAVGGVINIITRQDNRPWNVHLDGRYGQHKAQRYNFSLGLRQGIVRNTLTASRTAQDNYEVHNSGSAPETSTFTYVFGDKTWNFKDVLTADIRPNLHLTGRLGYFYRTVSRTADNPERYRDYSAGAKAVWDVTDDDHLEVSYAFDQYDKSDYQIIKDLDIRRYSNVQNTTRVLYTHAFDEGQTLTVGGDYQYDYLLNRNLAGDHHQQTADVFAQYDWRITPSWEVVGAVRYDYISEGSLSRVSPRLSVRYNPSRRVALRASYGMGFRAPTLKERYYDFDIAGIWILQGNSQLKPETSHNVNLSAEYAFGNYSLTASAYFNRVYDRITTGIPYYKTFSAPPSSRASQQLYLDYVNVDHLNVYGVEMTAQGRWQHGFSARVSYLFTHEDVAEAVNLYIPARPHSLTARFDWDRQWKKVGLNLSLSGRVLSGVDSKEYVNLYNIQSGTVTVHYPAYTLWKLMASLRAFDSPFSGGPKGAVRLNLTFDNLFNYRPQYYYYNAPLTTGFNVLAGISVDL